MNIESKRLIGGTTKGSRPTGTNNRNVLDIAGDAMSVLTVMEDMNKILPSWARKGSADVEGNESAQEFTKEGFDPEVAKNKARREAHEKFIHVDESGEQISKSQELPHAGSSDKYPGKSVRFWNKGPGPGALHVDFHKNYGIRSHWDAYAGGLENPGTALQHILFDAGPHMFGGAFYHILSTAEGYYRTYYIYQNNRKRF